MSLIQPLPPGPLDIVGAIHGELDALLELLDNLGYSYSNGHPQKRRLVFVGDFCDRGPNSPAVLNLVQELVQAGHATAVLGNHEINLMRGEAKDGSGWFFDTRLEQDRDKYEPFYRPTTQQRHEILAFLTTLPIGLERPDLRVIHATWQDAEIEQARRIPLGRVVEQYEHLEKVTQRKARESALEERMAKEQEHWEHGLENKHHQPPFMQPTPNSKPTGRCSIR